jgi:phospholipid transport system transporter-binding protein
LKGCDEHPLNEQRSTADNVVLARNALKPGLTDSMKDLRKKSRSKAAAPRRGRKPSAAVAQIPAIAAIPVHVPAPAVAACQVRVVLGTSCTFQEAAAIRAHLLAKAAQPGPYEIDGASVENIDTAGVQLIIAFTLDCLEKGVAYKWIGRSPTLEKAIELLGVAPLLEYPA